MTPLYDISIMKAPVALFLSLLIGQRCNLLFTFGEDSIAPFVFTAHPNGKIKRNKDGEKEVANGDDVWLLKTVSIEVRPINKDPVERVVSMYS